MKNIVRVLCALMAMLMLTTGALADVLKVDLPLVDEPVTLKILTQDPGSTKTISKTADAPVWKYLEETTGIKFEIEGYTNEDLSTKIQLIMADPDNYPDIFWNGGLNSDDISNYGAQGMLLDIAPYIDEYAPTLKKIFDENPQFRAFATSADGGIYTIPAFWETYVPISFAVNTRWLENCGITELPTNLDEFKAMLIAFRDMDANGNGDPNDEYPLNFTMSEVFGTLVHTTGMMLKWPWTGAVYGSDKGSTVTYPLATEERYKYIVNYIADLYAEGLMPSDTFTVTSDETNVRRLNDQFGVIYGNWYTKNEKYDPDEWVMLPLMTSQFIDEPSVFVHPGIAGNPIAISAFTKNPEACVAFIDYCMTADGSTLFMNRNLSYFDLEGAGVSPEVIEVMKPYMTNNQQEFYGMYGNQYLPQFTYTPNTKNNLLKTEHENLRVPYANAEVVRCYTSDLKYTEDELEVVSQYKTDLDTYILQKLNEWIVNGKCDAEWDAYIKQLKNMGIDKLTKVTQNAVNRWYGVE